MTRTTPASMISMIAAALRNSESRSNSFDARCGGGTFLQYYAAQAVVLASETDGLSALEFIGPFPSCQEAQAWHEEVWRTDTQYEDRLPWWVAALERPH